MWSVKNDETEEEDRKVSAGRAYCKAVSTLTVVAVPVMTAT